MPASLILDSLKEAALRASPVRFGLSPGTRDRPDLKSHQGAGDLDMDTKVDTYELCH